MAGFYYVIQWGESKLGWYDRNKAVYKSKSEKLAKKKADKLNEKGGNYVVRSEAYTR
jgi:hypothetical protein